MQEQGKLILKINIIPNGLEIYMRFINNNKLIFTDRFQFTCFVLDSLVKNLIKNDFKHSSQTFDNNLLDLVKEKGFYPNKYISCFEKFKEELPGKENFYSLLIDRRISDKEYEHVLNFWKKFEIKTMKYYQNLYLKSNVTFYC